MEVRARSSSAAHTERLKVTFSRRKAVSHWEDSVSFPNAARRGRLSCVCERVYVCVCVCVRVCAHDLHNTNDVRKTNDKVHNAFPTYCNTNNNTTTFQLQLNPSYLCHTKSAIGGGELTTVRDPLPSHNSEDG